MTNSRERSQERELRWLALRTATIVGTATVVLALALLLIFAGDFFLLLFAAILVAVFLHGLARFVRSHIRIPYGMALTAVVLCIVGVMVGAGFLLAPATSAQIEKLQQQLPGAVEQIREQVKSIGWLQRTLDGLPPPEKLAGRGGDLVSRVTGVFSGALTLAANLVLIVFVALYGAASPATYRKGILALIPARRQERADEILTKLADTLWWWLLGKLASMTIVGILTGIGLWVLGIPLAGVLALVAALFAFIPNIGPVLSAVPAVLVAFAQSPTDAMLVVILYVGIQLVESYLITPFIQKKAVSLPPALIISAQVLLGLLAGGLGLMLATPLMAATMVIVRELYVKDLLGNT